MTAIQLAAVVKRFADFTLGPIDLTIPTGLVTGLVGVNGSGKTTTIKLILGMLRADAGTIAAPHRREVGVLFDTPCYETFWTPTDIGKVLAPFYPCWDADRYADLLGRLGVPADRKVKDLSRGMAMKLQFAAALAHDPAVLLLDEPTSGLDPLARDEFCALVGEFVDDDRAVLFSTHITTDLDRIADHLVVLDGGRVVASGARDDLLDAYRLVRGGRTPLPAEVLADAFGVRTHSVGWDALVPAGRLDEVPPDAVADVPTIDDLVVRIGKGH